MKNTILASVVLAASLVLAGCKSTPMNHALFTTTVSTGVAFGVERYPEAGPYLQVAAPIICAAGEGTNVSPAEVVALLQNSPAANAVATPQGKLILNGALVLYIALFDSYGADYAQNYPQLRQYLQWTCEAIKLGAPGSPEVDPIGRIRLKGQLLPPHVK